MNPIKWDGKKISKPGVYLDLPIEVYHGDVCVGASVSSSGLRKIETQSPAHYWVDSPMNEDREPPDDKAHFSLGQAAHTLLLGEGGFKDKFSVRPAEYAGKKWNGNRIDCKQWLASQARRGRTVILETDMQHIEGMANALLRERNAADLLRGVIEASLIWQDKPTGVWLKARPDSIPSDSDMLADLKTTNDASPDKCAKSLMNFTYHMQMALCGWGLRELMGRTPTDYILIFCEKTPPYAVNIKPLKPSDITWALRQLRRSIDRFAECVETGTWPAYTDDSGHFVELPPFYRARLESDDAAGLLPKLTGAK